MDTARVSAVRWKGFWICSLPAAPARNCAEQFRQQEFFAESSCKQDPTNNYSLFTVLIIESIAMTLRLRDHEQPNRPRRWIPYLMPLAGHDANAASRADQRGFTFDLHHDFAVE